MTRKPRSKGIYIGITDEQDIIITALQEQGFRLNYMLEKGLEQLAPKVPAALIKKVKGLVS